MFIIKESNQQETEVPHLDALKEWIRAGRLTKSTPVRRASGGDWMTAGEIAELSGSFQSASPPPIPPHLPSQGTAPATAQILRTSKLAIASLILGVLSLVTLGITGIPGLICGFLARSAIRKKPTELKGNGIALAGILSSVLVVAMVPFIAILAGLTLPALAKAKERAATISCVNNMRQLALGIRIYANDHKDTFPMDLRSVSNEVINPKVLICPADSRPGADKQTITWENGASDRISYEYLAPGASETKLAPDAVILRCLIHGTEAYADGSVHQVHAPRRR